MPKFGLGFALVECVNIQIQLASMPSNAKGNASSSATSDLLVGPDFHKALSQASTASARPAIEVSKSNESNKSNKSNKVVQGGVETKVSMRGLTGVQDLISNLSESGKKALASVTVHSAAKVSKCDKNTASSVGRNVATKSDALPARTVPAGSLTPQASVPDSTYSCLTPDAQAGVTIEGDYSVGSSDQSSVAAVGGAAGAEQQLNLSALNTSLLGVDVSGQSPVSLGPASIGSADATSATQVDSGAGSCDSSQSAGLLNSSSTESLLAAVVPDMALLPALKSPVLNSASGLVSGSSSGKLAAPKRMDADASGKGGDDAAFALTTLEGKDPLHTVNEITAAVPFSGSQIKDEANPVGAASSAHLPALNAPSIKDHRVAVEVQAAPAAVDARSSSASIMADAVPAARTELPGSSLSGSSSSPSLFSNLTFSSVTAIGVSSVNSPNKTSGLGSITSSQKGKPASDLRSGSNGQAAAADSSQASTSNEDSQVAGSGSAIQTSVDVNSSHANTASDAALNQQNAMPVPESIQTAPVEVSGLTQPSVHNSDGSSSSASPAQAAADNGSQAAQAIPSVNNAQLIQSMHHSEMRLGMHSTEFGNLSISTSLNHQALSAQISTDHAELGRALAMHLPAMQEKLGSAYGMQARVEIRDGGSSSSYSNAGQQSKENRQSQPQGLAGSTMTSLDSSSISTNSSTASMYADSSRLDIRV